MTVLTKCLVEKAGGMKEPLVDNMVAEDTSEKTTDVEAAGIPKKPKVTRYIVSARVRPYYSLLFILMLVLLVTVSLLGLLGTEYLYGQYKLVVAREEKPEIYHATGIFSSSEQDDLTADGFTNTRFQKIPDTDDSILSEFNSFVDSLKSTTSKVAEEGKLMLQRFAKQEEEAIPEDDTKTKMVESFELDIGSNRYEKILVPSDSNSMIPTNGNNRFVHDFYTNFTAIVDVDNQRCFIMPLDRNVILPPKSLYDLLFKMEEEYYSVNTDTIRKEMKVMFPALDNLDEFGSYIKSECSKFSSFKLEKFVGGMVKRSAMEEKRYVMFSGKDVFEVQVFGLDNEGPRALP